MPSRTTRLENSTEFLATELLRWHGKHGAQYSFRKIGDPYAILVSEILLRQTQAVQLESIFTTLLSRFPTIRDLAAADPGEVAIMIRPLGMVRRAEDLVVAAKTIVEEHDGTVPSNREALLNLPGVGEYIAGCVLTLGYGKLTPAIDVNVRRVFSRMLGLERSGPRTELKIRENYSTMLRASEDPSLHHALIDLAHQICRRTEPVCPDCPMRAGCQYYWSTGEGTAEG